MNRRAFIFASLAASAAAAVTMTRAAAEVRVIYIGGQDCGSCQRWRSDAHPRWLASNEFLKIEWFEIEPITLKDAYEERNWPRALRPILAQVPRKSGTPRFLIVRDGQIVSNQVGLSGWQATLAELKQYLV